MQEMGRKEKKFCSQVCRSRYWSKGIHDEGSEYRILKPCANCGEAFESLKKHAGKYCSHECYIAHRFGLKDGIKRKEEIGGTSLVEGMEETGGTSLLEGLTALAPEPVFEESPEMPFEVAEEGISMMPVRVARADEKLRPRRVYLLSGRSNFQGKYDHFAGLIPLTERWGLLEGDVYVYCNAQRTQLSVLQWQGDGFALFFKRTEYTRYPWPCSSERKVIEIKPMDLRMLLEIPRLVQRLSGMPEG